MQSLFDIWPWLLAMGWLVACSAFFSASEAALFYLRYEDRRELSRGSFRQRLATDLLQDPDRLLTAVLFWNLVTNIAYFALASAAGLHLEARSGVTGTGGVLFAVGSVLAIIFLSEMLPKSLAVIRARSVSSLVSVPLSLLVRMVDPLMPVLRTTYVLSRRLIWPTFREESYLDVADLTRAIELSKADGRLAAQEQAALQNVVLLSEIRVDEWMRPRTQFTTFRPPVSLDQLEGKLTPSGYLLVTHPDSEEVTGAIDLKELFDVPHDHLEYLAQKIVVVPWCMRVADALEELRRRDRKVAVVVNELGETIGVLTFDDMLDTIFNYEPSRSDRLLSQKAVEEVAPGVWRVAGMTSVRRLSRYLGIDVPRGKSVTLGGAVQEALERLAEEGDICTWGPFECRVVAAPGRGQLLIEIRHLPEGEDG